MDKHQREVVYFAQDLFNFLSKKRSGINEIPKSTVKSNFSEEIGNACAYMLQFSRSVFLDILHRNFPDCVMDSRTFVVWFEQLLERNYSREPNDPFSGAIESLSWMFEAAAYAAGKGHPKFYHILPILWTEYFQNNLYPAFFDKGGWSALKSKSKDVAGTYKKFFVEHHPGAMELIAGLREDAPAAEGATGGCDPSKQIKVPGILRRAGYPPTVDESSSLAQTIKGLCDIKLEAAIQPVIQEAYEKYYTPEATSAEELPGSRTKDPIRIRLGGSPPDSCPPSPEKTDPVSPKGDESSFVKSSGNKANRRRGRASEPCSKIEKSESSCKNESAKDGKKEPKERSSLKRKK